MNCIYPLNAFYFIGGVGKGCRGGGGVNGSDLQGSLTVKSRGGNLTQNAEAFPERLQIEEEVRNCL